MEKIKEITQEQLEDLQKSKNPIKIFKDLVGIETKASYGMGDTLVLVDNSKPLELYKNVYGGKDTFYLIVDTRDERTGFAWTLYPKH